MTREEAIKAMIDGEKITHSSFVSGTYLCYDNDGGKYLGELFGFMGTDSIKYTVNHRFKPDDGYLILKNKIKKYQILYKSDNDSVLKLSYSHYSNKKDFQALNKDLLFVRLFEETMIEVDDD